MNFVTFQYAFFLITVLLLYWQLPRRGQHLLLLIASYTFYAFWDWRFLGLIFLTSSVDFFAGKNISLAKTQRQAKYWLIATLVINLGVLGYFKYAGFFVDSFVALLSQIGINTHVGSLNIILPVGISFYTFQSISYSIDIYRKQLKPTASLLEFLTFVAFFPQLVAGPIVRAREFLFQMSEHHRFSWDNIAAGGQRILTGLVKKAIIADNLAYQIVDPVFANPADYSTSMLWLAAFAYAVQIYCDFSGYSNIAIGSARLFGYNLPENFRFPYLSQSFSEFWTRWHITMSRSFRDYVYIPLGGNRRGPARNLANLSATTLISGLWHGAAWHFVLWGGLHGALLVVQRLVPPSIKAISPPLLTFLVVQFCILITWVFFRALGLDSAIVFLSGMFITQAGQTIVIEPIILWCFGLFFIDHIYGYNPLPVDRLLQNPWVRSVFWLSLIMIAHNAMPEGENPFIYFQF